MYYKYRKHITTTETPKGCIPQCVHVEITDEMMEQAEKEAKLIAEQKGANNPTTLVLNSKMDLIGALAQNGVKRQCDLWGIALEDFTSFFDVRIHADNYDFKHRGLLIDIQGTPMGKFPDGTPVVKVYPNSRFLTKNDKQKKKVDKYLFCSVDIEKRLVHIVGLIGYDELWNSGQEFEAVGNFKVACHYCLAHQTHDFKKFIFGT